MGSWDGELPFLWVTKARAGFLLTPSNSQNYQVFAGIAIFFLATHAYYHSTEPFKPENMRRSVLNFIRTAIIVEWLMWSTILRWILFLFKCNTYGNINLPGDGSGNRGGYDQDSKQYLLEMDLTVSCATTGKFRANAFTVCVVRVD